MRITIKHNHGMLTLENASIAYVRGVRSIVGRVVEGYTTNRLLHVSSTTKELLGEEKVWPIWGTEPWQKEDGSYFINTEFL